MVRSRLKGLAVTVTVATLIVVGGWATMVIAWCRRFDGLDFHE